MEKKHQGIEQELQSWEDENKVQRLWDGDTSLWSAADEDKWLGWLNLSYENSDALEIEKLAKELIEANFEYVVLMGMGGSSLCPAMMAETYGKIEGYPELHILDSTNPAQIAELASKIDLRKTFFIVSSKSGSTLEPNLFKEYFFKRLQTLLGKEDVGYHFCAVTDPGSTLDKLAKTDNFRAVFHGIPSIGGRYSALSNFGLVPSILMGVDIKEFFRHVEEAQQACSPRVNIKKNPGVRLGVNMGTLANLGKDKVTLIASPEIHALGAWLEQLLAESTGKIGKGLIPLDQEPLGEPSVYSKDRQFIYIRLDDSADEAQDDAVKAIQKAGHEVYIIHLANKMHLGFELFRWEFATAVAGSVIGINAFNQPDVEGSKVLTIKLAEQFDKTGTINPPSPFYSEGEISLFADDKNKADILVKMQGEESLEAYIRAHLDRVNTGDYVNLSAFIQMSEEHTEIIQDMRKVIRDHKYVATCFGFGPRFLHSTGQAYKGGPNTGVFFQITAENEKDIPIPGHNYTFGLVITAQAQADYVVLTERSRRALRIHLGNDVVGGLEKLFSIIKDILKAE